MDIEIRKIVVNCLRCPMKNDDDDCVLQRPEDYRECDNWDEQMARCPLIPVPDHGDLIERDRAVGELVFDYAYAAADLVKKLPTVIPADREGEA